MPASGIANLVRQGARHLAERRQPLGASERALLLEQRLGGGAHLLLERVGPRSVRLLELRQARHQIVVVLEQRPQHRMGSLDGDHVELAIREPREQAAQVVERLHDPAAEGPAPEPRERHQREKDAGGQRDPGARIRVDARQQPRLGLSLGGQDPARQVEGGRASRGRAAVRLAREWLRAIPAVRWIPAPGADPARGSRRSRGADPAMVAGSIGFPRARSPSRLSCRLRLVSWIRVVCRVWMRTASRRRRFRHSELASSTALDDEDHHQRQTARCGRAARARVATGAWERRPSWRSSRDGAGKASSSSAGADRLPRSRRAACRGRESRSASAFSPMWRPPAYEKTARPRPRPSVIGTIG